MALAPGPASGDGFFSDRECLLYAARADHIAEKYSLQQLDTASVLIPLAAGSAPAHKRMSFYN